MKRPENSGKAGVITSKLPDSLYSGIFMAGRSPSSERAK